MCVTEFFPSAPGNLQVFEGRKKKRWEEREQKPGGKGDEVECGRGVRELWKSRKFSLTFKVLSAGLIIKLT